MSEIDFLKSLDDVRAEIKKEIDLDNVMQGMAQVADKPKSSGAHIPPWEHDPEMPRESIWWMMGKNGDYFDAFKAWFVALPKEEQASFTWRYPEPAEWQGFYDALMGDG